MLTGNVLKDPDYIYGYHMGTLKDPDGNPIAGSFQNKPTVTPNDADAIIKLLERLSRVRHSTTPPHRPSLV